MKHSRFVHLHLHTDYSFLDGACRIDPLIEKAVSFKMPAIAITDHGNMCGVIKFYEKCIAGGIKPIIGCEFYVAQGSRNEKTKETRKNYHITLLARDTDGYLNLMRLNELAYKEGFYRKPRIDMELIKRYNKGLIALSGCLQSKISRFLIDNNYEKAVKEALEFNEIFGSDNFYLEMMFTGIQEQNVINEGVYKIFRETGIGCVATNDCHYIEKDDAYSQEILLCIGTGKKIDDPKHLKFSTDEYYLKSPVEMVALFKDYPEAIENTVKVAEKCNLQIKFGNNLLPEYEVPDNISKHDYLEKLCLAGISKRYGKSTTEVEERLKMELDTIKNLGFSGYFLICWDFINFAKNNDIPVGPGRGSGAGSIVSYLLGITNLDPLKYGLLFERFLNPERSTLPDLDIDFADVGREKVIEYVKEKYGNDRVGQIATFSTLKARAAIRDVGRVLGISLPIVDKIAKITPDDLTIYRALKEVSELKNIYRSDKMIKQMLDIARKIEGCKRQPGLHAAGVVIAMDNLSGSVPRGVSSDNRTVTQYEGEDLVKLGLLKMDFLGLRVLSTIKLAVENIKGMSSIDIDIDKISLDDKKAYELISNSETLGIFQLESSGFQGLLRRMDIKRFEDIVALVALYRPGVMKSGMTEEYINRMKDPKKINYPHSSLKGILKETYGVVLYQEQVMQVARQLSGFSPAQADDMRKAMSKKIPETLLKMRNDFIDGAVRNKISRSTASEIFDTLSKFAAYGFNKSHSAAYALLAYQTAYLKANFPTEYMSALLTCEMGDTDKIALYIAECKRMGLNVKRPDVVKSDLNFKVEENQVIRYGLKAIKNVGEAAIESIISSRMKGGPFKSFYDFCCRVDLQKVNRRVIESLIKAGAFDLLGLGRQPVFNIIDSAMSQAAGYQKDIKTGQTSFFEVIDGGTSPEVKVLSHREWHDNELLQNEKEALGFYFSGHPLTEHRKEIANLTSGEIKYVKEKVPVGSDIILAGLVKHLKNIKTRNGMMTVFILEDLSEDIETILFPSSNSPEMAEKISNDSMLAVIGRLVERRGHLQCVANNVLKIEEAKTKLVRRVVLKLNIVAMGSEGIEEIKKILDKYPGNILVDFEVETKKFDTIKISTNTKTNIRQGMLDELSNVIGRESILLKGRGGERREERG